MQVRTEQGEAIGNLKSRDFIVSVAGGAPASPLQLEVDTAVPRKARTTAAVPTRLLLVLLTKKHGLRASLPAKLGMAWYSGWQVSVEDTRGTATAYASTASQLQAEIGKPPGARCTLECAMGDLMRFPGRKVVFLVTDRRVTVSRATMKRVLLEGVMVYHVGGDPAKQEVSYGGFLDFTVPIPNAPDPGGVQSEIGGLESEYERRRGWETEDGSLRSALMDAVEDAKGYYDLKVDVPSYVDGLTLKVKVEGNPGAKFSIFAEPYANGAAPPALTLLSAKE